MDCLLLCTVAVDQVFGCAAENDLASDADCSIFLETDGRLFLVPIIKDNGDTGFCYSGLAALVYQVLESRWMSAKGYAWTRVSCSSRTCKFCARTVDMFVIPRTKQMESRMLDFPLPFRPVMELKLSSLRQLATTFSAGDCWCLGQCLPS